LTVMYATEPDSIVHPDAAFIAPDRFRPSDLPTVMRKAFDLVR
jgi:A/G-specific adenine glycosylase